VYRQSGPLDRELIDWRAEGIISGLYEEVYQHLADHPIVKTIQLVERLHSVRGAVHGLNPGIEAAHPDGLWADLRQLCEEAGWELARLELVWAKAERSQGPRAQVAQPERPQPQEQKAEGVAAWRPSETAQDPGVRLVPDRNANDIEGFADHSFGEADL
jgi:hypothetical protein